jgi:predicted thioesterase
MTENGAFSSKKLYLCRHQLKWYLMEIIIEKGLKGYKEQQVELKDTAKAYKSGLVEVFATPAMIALMENTAHSSISSFLPEGFITVGIQLNIEHSKATPLGAKVWCESVLEDQEGRKLRFSVTAYDETGIIGKGTHERFIVDVEKFMGKLKKEGRDGTV